MLVLSRHEGEEVIIGDNIVISVQRIEGNRVRIGVQAPNDMKILRSELKPVKPTLEQWLERWEDAVESGQSRISREEAERRYYKTHKDWD